MWPYTAIASDIVKLDHIYLSEKSVNYCAWDRRILEPLHHTSLMEIIIY